MTTAKRNMRKSLGLAASTVTVLVAVFVPILAQKKTGPPNRPWMDKSLSPDRRADLVIEQMTLDEKIQLVHGVGMFRPSSHGQGDEMYRLRSNGGAGFIPGIERLGIPDLQMADSAYGVTRGAQKGRYSTALPSDLAGAASWDPKLMYEYGSLIGRELRAEGYNMSLAGGVNITREPRNGRNFEYQGEDPILAGKMVAQLIRGIQDQGVIGDLKHYALNDQETGRNIDDARLDHRSMRETDLLAFEIGVKDGNPGAVMCSYNRINGDYACENSYTLNDVLKKAWGFKGWVISDWGGTHSTAKAALAGLDQEMPNGDFFGPALKTAVEGGGVPTARLNDMVHRILRTEFAVGIIDKPPAPQVPDVAAGLDLAQRAEEQGIVLLKNANGQLPLNAAALKSIAVIGSHADAGVISGGGSAQVDAPGGNAVPPSESDQEIIVGLGRGAVWYHSAPLKTIRARAPNAKVEYDSGADPAAAAKLAKTASVAIVFVNQPASEGRDLPSLSLPGDQDALVAAVAAANPHTIVVLETGGPVTMPWLDSVSAAVEAWFPGIRGAEAITRVLFGDVNPSGKLPVTFAKSEDDLPHPRIAGSELTPKVTNGFAQWPAFAVEYSERLKVGYKWFDAEDKQPLFAFGYGLTYTNFEYTGLKLTGNEVAFTLKNTGRRAGAEIAQVYVSLPPAAGEPPRRLVAWDKVELAPGESKTVTCKLEPKFLSIFNETKNDWELLPGEYRVYVGGSSRTTPLTAMLKRP